MKADDRRYPWPPLRKTRSGYVVKARFMTPFRHEMLNTFVRTPLAKLWRLLAGLLALELLLTLLGWSSPLDYLPYTPAGIAAAMAVLSMLHYVEMLSRLWLSILLFGKRVRFEVTEDEIVFGHFWWKRRFSRSRRIVFTASPIQDSKAPGYVDSRLVEAVVDNLAAYRLLECYDVRKANQLVVNCNYAASFGDHSTEKETDPRDR